VRAIEEAKRDKVVQAAIECGRNYRLRNPNLSRDDANFRKFDVGRTLIHIRNSARRMMEEFEFGYGPETWPVAKNGGTGVAFISVAMELYANPLRVSSGMVSTISK
jgi:hypothetical protein